MVWQDKKEEDDDERKDNIRRDNDTRQPMLVFLLILTFVKQDSEQSIRPSKTQRKHNLKQRRLSVKWIQEVCKQWFSVCGVRFDCGRFISDWQGFNRF